MFSFGIFTTHIPYVAFVVFYAYFLIFGVEKASKGEFNTHGKSFATEMHVAKQVSADNQTCFFYQTNDNYIIHSAFEAFLFKRIIKYRTSVSALLQQFEILTSLSNRPPPFIS